MFWTWLLSYGSIRDVLDPKKYTVKYLGVNSATYSEMVQGKKWNTFGGVWGEREKQYQCGKCHQWVNLAWQTYWHFLCYSCNSSVSLKLFQNKKLVKKWMYFPGVLDIYLFWLPLPSTLTSPCPHFQSRPSHSFGELLASFLIESNGNTIILLWARDGGWFKDFSLGIFQIGTKGSLWWWMTMGRCGPETISDCRWTERSVLILVVDCIHC